MTDITGVGSRLTIKASVTFPNGFVVTQFADDADAFDFPNREIAQVAIGANGQAVSWNHASLINFPISVVANSEDDLNLQVLFNANTVAQGKTVANDVIQINIAYPNGQIISLNNGKLTSGPTGNAFTAAGRLKSKQYTFMFESSTVTGA